MKYGYFDDDNKEYVIDRPDIPVSWTNYLGVDDLCTVICTMPAAMHFINLQNPTG